MRVLLFSVLILISCGTRRVATTIDKEETKEVVSTEIDQKTGEIFNAYKNVTTTQNNEQNEREIKFVRVKEYNDNGSLRREIESNEEFSKMYKSEISTLEKAIETKEKIIEILKVQNSEYQKKMKTKEKKTESKRPMWWLYILIYLLGVATVPTLKSRIKL